MDGIETLTFVVGKSFQNSRRVAHYRRIGRDILDDDRARANEAIMSDVNIPQ